MQIGRSTPPFLGLLTLLVGVSGCEERSRPIYLGPGDQQGPVIQILVPAESTTVHRNATFTLGVRASDPDGVDSVWVDLEPNVNTLQDFGGGGAPSATAGYSVLVPAGVVEDTLVVIVRARDVLGDTSDVFIRRLLVAD
jgi:hypothetical protein